MKREKYFYLVGLLFVLVPLLSVVAAAYFGAIKQSRVVSLSDVSLLVCCLAHAVAYSYLAVKYGISKNFPVGLSLVCLGLTATVQIPFSWTSNPSPFALAGALIFFLMINSLCYYLPRSQS